MADDLRKVSHADGLNAEDVADHAVGLIIAAWRGVVAGDQMVRAGAWTPAHRLGARPGLRGRKVGIVGMGHIGEAVALRVEAFGTVDEANAVLGVLRLHLAGEADAMVARIQNELFDVGADLCVPGEAGARLRVAEGPAEPERVFPGSESVVD